MLAAIGNALTVAATPKELPDIIALALDPAHGEARSILLMILKRSKKPEAKLALMKLIDDSSVGKWAQKYVKNEKQESHRKN